jgi:proteic killer suppression protein
VFLLKLVRILDRLDALVSVSDMNLPGFKFHKLSGNGKNIWAVSISGNWRITFYFENEDAYVVDYLDYH